MGVGLTSKHCCSVLTIQQRKVRDELIRIHIRPMARMTEGPHTSHSVSMVGYRRYHLRLGTID